MRAAEAYLKYLYTDAGQEIIARHFYRPSSEAVLRRHAATFPALRLFSIKEIALDFPDAHKQFIAEGGAELGFKAAEKKQVARLRGAFSTFDRSRNRGLLLIDEAQVLADKRHHALEKALRALLDTRKDRLKVIFTGSSEDRLRTMFGAENKAFYNWARVEPLPLLGAARQPPR